MEQVFKYLIEIKNRIFCFIEIFIKLIIDFSNRIFDFTTLIVVQYPKNFLQRIFEIILRIKIFRILENKKHLID